MNTTHAYARSPAKFGRILALVVVSAVIAAQLVAPWIAPFVAVPLLVASWVIGLGLVVFLPFAIVVAAAWVVSR